MIWLRFSRHFAVMLILSCGVQLEAQMIPAAPMPGATVPGRFLVLYRDGVIPADAELHLPGARMVRRHSHLGVALVAATTDAGDAETLTRLAAQPDVLSVVQDRIVMGQRMDVRAVPNATSFPAVPQSTAGLALAEPVEPDVFYSRNPQDWAVQQVGGYGTGVAGGLLPTGPWDVTMGAGVRIAILDSGIDAHHPDLAPNLALNLSEIDRTALPSACDDGTAQDQVGHGTWAASLAAAALGPGTGLMVGVAPSATLLNIKVLQRMPGDGATPEAQCAAGQASGLLSWVVQGINDAVSNHADVISLSLGTLVDTWTGDGSGLKATFDQVTHAASNAGVVIVAAAGNDGFDLSSQEGRYVELPAQARDVLAIVASTNPACRQDTVTTNPCAPGPPTLAYYSNFGTPLNALAAPGGSYPAGDDFGVSGWVRGACTAGRPNTETGLPDAVHSFGCFNLGHTEYVQAIGTSASAPLAAGVAALVRAAHPHWTSTAVIAAMRASAITIPGLLVPQITAAAVHP